jgi:phosphatidylglycerophosphate synthase
MHIENIKKIYRENLNSKSYEIAFLVVIFRFISPPFVYFLSEWKVNPLHISYLNLFIVISALFLFLFASNIYIPIALLALWQFVDTLDGGVARTRQMISNYGGFIDQISGMIMLSFLPFIIGVAASVQIRGGLVYENYFLNWLTPEIILILGGFSSVSAIFSRFINHTIKIRFGEDNSKRVTSERYFNNILKIIIINIENIGGINLIILLIFSLIGMLPLYVFIFALINTLIMLYVLSRALIDYRNYTNYLS